MHEGDEGKILGLAAALEHPVTFPEGLLEAPPPQTLHDISIGSIIDEMAESQSDLSGRSISTSGGDVLVVVAVQQSAGDLMVFLNGYARGREAANRDPATTPEPQSPATTGGDGVSGTGAL